MGDGHLGRPASGRGTSASGRPRPAAGWRRRLGRTGRGAPRETGGRRRAIQRAWDHVPPVGRLVHPARAVRDLPVLRERGQPLSLWADHAHLRAAGAGTQRRGRLRRATRPGLRRLLRVRRVPLRDHGLGAFRTPPPGGDRDPDRDGVDCAAWPPARPRLVAAARRLPRDRDAVLPASVRDLRQQRERRPQRLVVSLRGQGRPDRGRERARPDRPAQLLRLRDHHDEAVLLLHADLAGAVDDHALLRQRLPDRKSVARAARGSAGCRDDEHSGQPAEAARVHVRRSHRGLQRSDLRRRPIRRVPGRLRRRPADHDLRHRHPRGTRQHRRRRGRRADHQRRAGAAPLVVERPLPLLRRDPARALHRAQALVQAGDRLPRDGRVRIRRPRDRGRGLAAGHLGPHRGRRPSGARARALGAAPEPHGQDRRLGVLRADRRGARADAPARLVAHDRSDPHPLPRSLRVGEQARSAGVRSDAADPPRARC